MSPTGIYVSKFQLNSRKHLLNSNNKVLAKTHKHLRKHFLEKLPIQREVYALQDNMDTVFKRPYQVSSLKPNTVHVGLEAIP